MNQRVRYAYTYFLHPFKVRNIKTYYMNLLKNNNIAVKVFEKEKDIDIYSYFSTNAKEDFFKTFNSEKINIEKMNLKQQVNYFSKHKMVCFEYKNETTLPAKLGEKDGIFFTIEKMDIICFSNGICFLAIKTQIEDIQEFSQTLDFNYKFREICLGNNDLRDYENIKIHTDSFENADELIELINKLTFQYTKEKQMYVYSYVCIDSEGWKKQENFETIQEGFEKLINVKHSQDKEKILYNNPIYKTSFIKASITKNALGVIASSKEDFNYTKLPYYFERQYLYTVIIGLYAKESVKNNILIKKIEELTTDELGTHILESIYKQFEIDKKQEEYQQQQNILKKEKEKKINYILLIALLASLALNIVNLWILLKIK